MKDKLLQKPFHVFFEIPLSFWARKPAYTEPQGPKNDIFLMLIRVRSIFLSVTKTT